MQQVLRALIVEDSEDDALLLVRQLRCCADEVVFERVETAEAMKAALAKGQWDLVIADYAMPHFCGLAALAVLKESGLDLPFIVCSGAIGEDLAVEIMREGAHDYVMKGKLARLVPAVERELRDAQVRRERKLAQDNLLRAHDELEQRVRERTLELARANDELNAAKQVAESANRAKDHFLAVLSHELRTPLTPALTAVQIMEADRSLSPDLREMAGMIRRNVELEARLIDDLLDITRISRGKLQLHFETADVHLKIAQIIQMCEGEAQAKRIRVSLDLSAADHHVQADKARLQQILWNLLKNAIKFTPVGGSVAIRSGNEPAGQIWVSVTDTGIGIAPDVLPRLFEPFEQGETEVTRLFGGLGLGLSISKGLVDLHGGTLCAESEGKGRGSTFTLRLPASSAPITPDDQPVPGADRSADHHDCHVLLVEDHADTRKMMARLIESLGYHVRTADSMAGALVAARAEKFDVLVSDIGLPDGSGLELMRQVLGMYKIAGVALSGFGQEEDVRKSREAGFQAHITKPISVQSFAETLQKLARN